MSQSELYMRLRSLERTGTGSMDSSFLFFYGEIQFYWFLHIRVRLMAGYALAALFVPVMRLATSNGITLHM